MEEGHHVAQWDTTQGRTVPHDSPGASTSEIQRPGRSSLEKKDLGSGQYGRSDSSIAAPHDPKQTAIQPDQSCTLDRPMHMTAKESNWKSLLYGPCSMSSFTQTSAKRTCLSDWRLRTSSINSAPPRVQSLARRIHGFQGKIHLGRLPWRDIMTA